MAFIESPYLQSVTPVSSSRVRLVWINNDLYDLIMPFYRPQGGGSWTAGDALSGTATTYDFSGLPDGSGFDFEVIAYSGGDSATSGSLTCATILPDPSSLYGRAASDTAINIYWNDNSQNESGFEVYMDGALYSTEAANVTTKYISGLGVCTYHEFQVRAVNAVAGSGLSNLVRILTGTPPAAASGLVATATGTTTARLNWIDNADNETGYEVWQSADGSTGWAKIATLGPNIRTYAVVSGLVSNVAYWWKVIAVNASGNSGDSNIATTTTFAAIAPPSNLRVISAKVGGVLGNEATFDDNSTLETDHRLCRRLYYATEEWLVNGGLETWTNATTPGTWTKSVAGTSTVNQESTEKHGGAYSLKGIVDASNSTAIIDQIITPGAGKLVTVSFWYKTAAGKTLTLYCYNNPGANVFLKSDGTWAASGAIVIPASTTWVQYTLTFTTHASYASYRLYFGHSASFSTQTSSSFYIDDISIIHAFAEIVTLEPNRTYYFDGPLTAGLAYEYRARARQSGSPDVYSAYSANAHATVIAVPTAPSGLVLSEVQNTSMRVTWTPGDATEAGFIIETSPDNATWTEKGRSCKGSTNYKIRGLAASTLVYVRVCAFNAAGSSAYAAAASATTLAVYAPSAFERVCGRQNGRLRYYVEVQPARRFRGWTLSSGKTYTYEITVPENRIAFDGMKENGAALTLRTSIATVEAAAGSWWYDTAARKMYVRSLGGLAPINYVYVGTFWAYFSTWSKAGDAAAFNGNQYLPLIATGGIPDVSMSISPIWQGSFTLSSGSIKLINGKRKMWAGYFFDQRAETWIWENRPARILAGAPGATYAQLETIHTAIIQSTVWGTDSFELVLGDIRSGRAVSLPSAVYSIAEFPSMDPNLKDQARPFWYGANTGIIPKCIDTVNRVFEFHNGRMHSVQAVRQNAGAAVGAVVLAAGTDYFIDYQRGRITLARGLTYATSDVIDGDITGHVDDAGSSLDHGPLQFIDYKMRHAGLAVSELGLDSIYETHDALTAHLGWGAYKGGQDSQEFDRLIEQSCLAWSTQDAQGRAGLRRKATAAPSGVVYIKNAHISGPSSTRTLELYASEVVINYAEDSGDSGRFQSIKKSIPASAWERGVQTSVPITTAMIAEADAIALGDEVVAEFGRVPIGITVPSLAWKLMPGDAFYLTMSRYPNADGLASVLLMRVLAITKSPAKRSTTITAEAI